MENFPLKKLQAIPTKCLGEIFHGGELPKGYAVSEILNEIKPAALYSYLHARFGPPNGIQNFLRGDHSDNLIHWEWTLAAPQGPISIQGLNFRTEVHFWGDFTNVKTDKYSISTAIKNDIKNYRKEISELKKSVLENWSQFVNPYQRIESSISSLMGELDSLNLNPQDEHLTLRKSPADIESYKEKWEEISEKYNRSFGLCFGIRSMIPILGECFVNLLFYILCKPEIKEDKRLFENCVRQNIDIKIKSLHINCVGFKEKIDWSNETCKKYNSVINERNDLLHGNFVIEKLKFDEVLFNGKVPIFKEYKTIWERSLGVTLESVGFKNIKNELKSVQNFIEYTILCLEEGVKDQVQRIVKTRDMGINENNGKIGILFSNHFADFRMQVKEET